jgi:hypothetical protein
VIFSKCPRCGSGRIRRGYRPSSVLLKLFGRYNLLCDECNWEFTGFAIPGTVSAKPTKKRKKPNEKPDQENEEVHLETNASESTRRVKKKIKVKQI